MEQNPESALAWQFIESTGTHLFLTGKAGTGKTTFLRKLKQESPKRMVVVAPTGIAAINAGGVTIHSFFQIPFAPYVPESSFSTNGKASYRFRFGKEKINIIRSMDLLVIDEISMVRADLLDAVEQREKQFNEKWLVLVAADHGGSKQGHGKQVAEHRTIWMACNYPVEQKYFGVHYNGFQEER